VPQEFTPNDNGCSIWCYGKLLFTTWTFQKKILLYGGEMRYRNDHWYSFIKSHLRLPSNSKSKFYAIMF